MYRALTAVGSGALAAGILLSATGCGNGAPALEKPNNSLEVATNNIDYASTLGTLTLSQTIRIILPTILGEKQPQQLNVWNFTNSKVNPAQLRSAANYLITDVADSAQTWTFPVNYSDGTSSRKLFISTYPSESLDPEHDMLQVPYGETPPPGNFQGGGTKTEYLDEMEPSEPETVSVVYQAEDNSGNLEPFFGPDSGLSIEMCQSVVSTILNTNGLDPNLDDDSIEFLDQETFCNSQGELINAVLGGMSYSGYVNYILSQQGGIVYDNTGKSWVIDPFTVSSAAYAQAKNELIR